MEGFSQADKAINSATKSGRWVMLKNVHLAPQWLVQLEKKLHSLTPHANFRLFLTMEINPKVNHYAILLLFVLLAVIYTRLHLKTRDVWMRTQAGSMSTSILQTQSQKWTQFLMSLRMQTQMQMLYVKNKFFYCKVFTL